jgi:hypothetical protein
MIKSDSCNTVTQYNNITRYLKGKRRWPPNPLYKVFQVKEKMKFIANLKSFIGSRQKQAGDGTGDAAELYKDAIELKSLSS